MNFSKSHTSRLYFKTACVRMSKGIFVYYLLIGDEHELLREHAVDVADLVEDVGVVNLRDIGDHEPCVIELGLNLLEDVARQIVLLGVNETQMELLADSLNLLGDWSWFSELSPIGRIKKASLVVGRAVFADACRQTSNSWLKALSWVRASSSIRFKSRFSASSTLP